MQNPDLWHRISSCHPDDMDAVFPFSKRLARDNGWSPAFANRVIREYLKFVYLGRLGLPMVTPSDEVDQAWHLHMTYTRHYWGPFKEALGAPLHHMPTKGGTSQAETFEAAYAATLERYRQEFGDPPADIWPPVRIRFGKAPHFQRLNTQDYWILRKPGWPSTIKVAADRLVHLPTAIRGTALVLLTLFAGTSFALAHGNPAGATWLDQLRNMVWHWATQHTVWFAVCVIALGLILAALFQKSTKGSGCGTGGCSTAGSDGGDGGGSGCGGCGD